MSTSATPPEADFSTLVSSLAMQALVHLGKIPNPMTKEAKTDLPAAQYSIDLLAMLREKTKGNLAADEERLLETALADLRMHYVEAAKS